MAGTIAADTLTHSTAGSLTTDYVVKGSAKQFLSFHATNNVTNISLNVASVTDNGTGDFTPSYTNNFNASEPVVQLSADLASSANPGKYVYARGTSSHRVYPYRSTGGVMTQGFYIATTAFGDLA